MGLTCWQHDMRGSRWCRQFTFPFKCWKDILLTCDSTNGCSNLSSCHLVVGGGPCHLQTDLAKNTHEVDVTMSQAHSLSNNHLIRGGHPSFFLKEANVAMDIRSHLSTWPMLTASGASGGNRTSGSQMEVFWQWGVAYVTSWTLSEH